MGQVTIYLDDANEKRLKAAAKAAGIPVSRWIADLVQAKTRTVWPDSVHRLAGRGRMFRTWPSSERRQEKTALGKRFDVCVGHQHADLFFPRPGESCRTPSRYATYRGCDTVNLCL